jgi:hypothetical protein
MKHPILWWRYWLSAPFLQHILMQYAMPHNTLVTWTMIMVACVFFWSFYLLQHLGCVLYMFVLGVAWHLLVQWHTPPSLTLKQGLLHCNQKLTNALQLTYTDALNLRWFILTRVQYAHTYTGSLKITPHCKHCNHIQAQSQLHTLTLPPLILTRIRTFPGSSEPVREREADEPASGAEGLEDIKQLLASAPARPCTQAHGWCFMGATQMCAFEFVHKLINVHHV